MWPARLVVGLYIVVAAVLAGKAWPNQILRTQHEGSGRQTMVSSTESKSNCTAFSGFGLACAQFIGLLHFWTASIGKSVTPVERPCLSCRWISGQLAGYVPAILSTQAGPTRLTTIVKYGQVEHKWRSRR